MGSKSDRVMEQFDNEKGGETRRGGWRWMECRAINTSDSPAAAYRQNERVNARRVNRRERAQRGPPQKRLMLPCDDSWGFRYS